MHPALPVSKLYTRNMRQKNVSKLCTPYFPALNPEGDFYVRT